MPFKIASSIQDFCDIAPPRDSTPTGRRMCGMPHPGKPLPGVKPKDDIYSYKNEDPKCTATSNPSGAGVCCAKCSRIVESGPNACPVPDKICQRVQKWAQAERKQYGLGEEGFKGVTKKEEIEELEKKYPGITERYRALFNYLKEMGFDIVNWPEYEKHKKPPPISIEDLISKYLKSTKKPYMYIKKYPGIENDPAFKKDLEVYENLKKELAEAIKSLDPQKAEQARKKLEEWKPIHWHAKEFEKEPHLELED